MKKLLLCALVLLLLSSAGCLFSSGESNSGAVSKKFPEETAQESAVITQAPTETAAPITPAPTAEVTEEPAETPAAVTPAAETPVPETPAPTPETTPEPAYTENDLIILQDAGMYTYDDMMHDTEVLLALYPDCLTEDVLATTADGRSVIHFVVGNPSAEKQIFINGAIHAREYLTAQLVMKQMVTYIRHVRNGDFYGDVSYADMWQNCAVHVVPMVNPDGVSISQSGLDGIRTEAVLNGLYEIAAMDGTDLNTYYLDRWKANAAGVDLNRNFDAYWEEYADPAGHPSSDHYKGEYPGSEPESAALIDLTLNNRFLYTISYHTQGRLIYWCFDNMDPIYDISYAWVSQLAASTGYAPDGNYSAVDPAGYSDWGIYRCQIPSITLEVAYGESPYLADQFDQVFEENREVWEITIVSALNR